MAALRDGEQLSFKAFLSRRRTEYSLRFPFLTERQISAKLRRAWEFQKGARAPKCRKREQAPAIQLPPAQLPLITATSNKGQLCTKGDLSAFDIESDTSVHHGLPTTKQYSKYCYSVHQSCKTTKCPTPPDLLHTNLPSSRQTSDENTATVTQCVCLPPTVPPADRPLRQQLASLENSHTTTSPVEQCGIRDHCTSQHTPQYIETSPCTCEGLRKEVKCFATNTLPFASDEAQQDQSVVSKGRRGLRVPIMACGTTGVDLKHTPKDGMSEFTCRGRRYPTVCMACGVRQTPPLHHALCDTDNTPPLQHALSDSGQSSAVSCDHRTVPLSKKPTIQSLPSPCSAAPSESAFPLDSARLMPKPIASSDYQISSCSVFDTRSQGANETPLPTDSSDPVSHDSSDAALDPLTSFVISSNTITASPVCRAPVASGNTTGVRSSAQRRCVLRRKLRVKTFSHCRTAFRSPLSSEREQQHSGRRNGETVACGTSVHKLSIADTLNTENRQSNSKHNSNEGLVDSTDVGGVSSSSCTSEWEERGAATEQLVPVHTPHNTPPHNHPAERDPTTTTTTTTTAGSRNLMCDMFQSLTPERPKGAQGDRHHSGGAAAQVLPSKRRVFRSACTEGNRNFYSMFIDESDIFM